MEILELFKKQLTSSSSDSSKNTVKNYISDVRHFIQWIEKATNSTFDPENMRPDLIILYQKSLGADIVNSNLNFKSQLSVSSMKRHLSSLRRFFTFLEKENYISQNPFDSFHTPPNEEPTDYWHLKSFKDYLLENKASRITIKNYLSDVSGFAKWYEEAILPGMDKPLSSTQGFYLISQGIINDYRDRLLEIQNAAPRTVNRKLSALRRYFEFVIKKGFVTNEELNVDPVRVYEEKILTSKMGTIALEDIADIPPQKRAYSIIPPIRLLQKLLIFPYLAFEEKAALAITSLVKGIPAAEIQDLPPQAAAELAAKNALRMQTQAAIEITKGRNIPKKFYAPDKVSLLGVPLHRRIIHHTRFTRPNWYKRYHNYPFVNYIHFALLVIFASGVGVALYQNLVLKKQSPTFAAATAPPRILSFQGRLTDNLDNPITTAQQVRFMIYNDSTSSSSAELWEEVRTITPDQDGIFSVLLGSDTTGANATLCGTMPPASPTTGACGIPSTVFSDNSQIWLGVTIQNTSELSPRQKIASVAYASNSEFLQGMAPITALSASDPKINTILNLDSSGNLIIDGDSNPAPTFQATSGQFTLSGKTLLLTTVLGTGTNVEVSPDGLGKIDLQKPLVNTTNNGSLTPGGVEVDDRFGVLATESAVAAFIINNDTTGGDILAASSSGTTRFRIANDGTLSDIKYNTLGGLIFGSNASGTLSQTTAGLLGQCLQSTAGATPTWGTCGGGGVFGESLGAIVPNNSTEDLLIGGQATSSAKFRFVNVSGGTPTASISANLGDNSTFISGDGTLGTTNRQTLTIGNSSLYNTTGNLLINPNGIGRIGIGTSSPLATLDLRGNSGTLPVASISANTTSPALLIDNSGTGDFISASRSGQIYFSLNANSGTWSGSPYDGEMIVGKDGNGKITAGIVDPYLVANQKTSGITSLTFQTLGTSNADFIYKNQSTELGRLSQEGQLSLAITGTTGGLVLGGDTQLFRGASDRLDLASGDSFNIVNGNLQTGGTTRIDSSGNGTFANLNITGTCTGCLNGFSSVFKTQQGAIVPNNSTEDFLIGGQATTSAKFAILNVSGSGTPTASVSSGLNGNSLLFDANGNIQTAKNHTLTLGGATTGNIILSPLNNAGGVAINKTTGPLASLDVKDLSSVASQGSEKITNSNDSTFTTDTGDWTTSGSPAWKINIASSGKAAKDAPGTGAITLSNSALDSAPAAGNTYRIKFDYTTTASSSGELGISFGGTTAIYIGDDAGMNETGEVQVVTAANSNQLTFTPNTHWYGTIDNVFVEQMTTSSIALRLEASDGSTNPLEIRTGSDSLKNIFIGNGSGRVNTTGHDNLAVGYQALYSNTIGYENTAIGDQALQFNTTGLGNTANGYKALQFNTTGTSNTAIGDSALRLNTTGISNTAIGDSALIENATGNYNTALGLSALESNTTGSFNTALGATALNWNNGDNNTAIGVEAMLGNGGNGSNNTAIGMGAISQIDSGNNNTGLGYQAGYGTTDGNNNVYLGYNAGYNNDSGSNNVFLGSNAGYSEIGSNKLYIANSSTSSPLILGNFAQSSLGINVNNAGLGNAALTVNQPNSAGDIFTASYSGSTKFVINNSGYVGIGTSTPNAALQLVGREIVGAAGTTFTGTEQLKIAGGTSNDTWINIAGSSNGVLSNDVRFILGQLGPIGFIGTATNNNFEFRTNNTARMTLENNGNLEIGGSVGIGTASSPTGVSPLAMLQVYSTLGTSPAASISAKTTGPTLLLSNDGPGYVFVASGAAQSVFAIDSSGNTYQAGGQFSIGSDYAEYFKKSISSEQFEAGQLVCLDEGEATKCTSSNPSLKLIGVVSDNATIAGNSSHKDDPGYVLVGMVGQLGIWVNGDVKPGDPLAFSSTPGVATSAKGEGNIIGYAKEGNNGASKRVDSVIQPNYYNPNTALQNEDTINTIGLVVDNGVYSAVNAFGKNVDHIDVFSKAIIANIEAGYAHIKQLAVDSITATNASLGNVTASTFAVAANTMTIGGEDIRDMIRQTVISVLSSQPNIISPLASADTLKTNVISPLADTSAPSLSFKDARLNINNSDKTVAWFDNQGNASLSGQLNAENIQTEDISASSSSFLSSNIQNLNSNNASVAGTLRAGNIIADNISGLDDKLATLAAAINNQGSNTYTQNIASSSSTTTNSQLLATDSVHANFGIFEQGITSMGPVTSNILTATDTLSVGNSFSITNNAINTVGTDLEIQSLRQGNIAFEGGLIRMDSDGNMSIGGNLNVLGEIDAVTGVFSGSLTTPALATNLISPLAGDDLTIQLHDGPSTPSGKLKIQNSHGQDVLSINSQGDITSSGAAQFAKLNFNLVGQAEATSLTEAVATGSAGFATLKQGQPELTIKNPNITSKSLIYITPFGDTDNKVLYLLRQVPNVPDANQNDPNTDIQAGSFTIGISGSPADRDIQFNWLIVN